MEACLEEEVTKFNKDSREDGATLISLPDWCSGSYRVTLDDNDYCCQSPDCSEQCDLIGCEKLVDCCAEGPNCRLGEGECDSNNECAPGLICGKKGDPNGGDNCKTQFNWVNGGDNWDCCILDPDDNDGTYTGPYAGEFDTRCGSDDCACNLEEKVVYIEDNGGDCETITEVGCKIDPRIVIFGVPTEICKDALNKEKLFEDDATKDQAVKDINDAFKCLYYSAFENSYEGGSYDCEHILGTLEGGKCITACDGRRDPIFGVRSGGGAKFKSTTRVCVKDEKDDEGNVLCTEGEILPSIVTTSNNIGVFFDYRIPAYLPPPNERLANEGLGQFVGYDIAIAATDETAAKFVIEVFEEFMTCAVSSAKF